MRINEIGHPGRYRCDRCGEPSPKGVYTGFGFMHVCVTCRHILKESKCLLKGTANPSEPPVLAPSKRRPALEDPLH